MATSPIAPMNPVFGPLPPQQFPEWAHQSVRAGTSVKFSPFEPRRLAYTGCDHFGIVGKGFLQIIDMLDNGSMGIFQTFQHTQSVFDVAWNEFNNNILISAAGYGQLLVWDIAQGIPLFELQGHTKDVNSVQCSYQNQNLLLSSSNDTKVILWDIQVGKQALLFNAHSANANQAVWHPVNDDIFASVSSDSGLQLWDVKLNQNIASIGAHKGHDVLTCDFSKYEELIATGGSDGLIQLWDIRKLTAPINILQGHRYPVKNLKFSPHLPSVIASASFDMNVNIWDISDKISPMKFQHKNHTEFVNSVDFNYNDEKLVVSTSWDSKIYAWNFDQPQPLLK